MGRARPDYEGARAMVVGLDHNRHIIVTIMRPTMNAYGLQHCYRAERAKDGARSPAVQAALDSLWKGQSSDTTTAEMCFACSTDDDNAESLYDAISRSHDAEWENDEAGELMAAACKARD